MAVVLLSAAETSGEGMAAFSGEFHSLKGGMLMIVACILLSLVAMLSAWIALGLAIIANENNEKDRPSEQD